VNGLSSISFSLRQVSRVAAWVLIAIITVLSFIPPGYRPVTPVPHNVEHFGIFLPTGLAFGVGYKQRHLLQSLALVLYSAAVELIQREIPGRHGRLSDFLVNAVSACLGVGPAALIPWVAHRIRRSAWRRASRRGPKD
jgi:VanZ family protein